MLAAQAGDGLQKGDETIATFVLVLCILMNPSTNDSLGYAAVAFVVIAIGFGLGGPTGYAIHPARISNRPRKAP